MGLACEWWRVGGGARPRQGRRGDARIRRRALLGDHGARQAGRAWGRAARRSGARRRLQGVVPRPLRRGRMSVYRSDPGSDRPGVALRGRGSPAGAPHPCHRQREPCNASLETVRVVIRSLRWREWPDHGRDRLAHGDQALVVKSADWFALRYWFHGADASLVATGLATVA